MWGLGLFGHISQSTAAVLDLVKLAFALVAGVGGTVGLVLAYRRHLIVEESNLRDRTKETREESKLFNERFEKAASQLGSGQHSVRVAGVYAMAGLADDWLSGRQMCIDVLCANVRQAFMPKPVTDAPPGDHLVYHNDREFKESIIREISSRLRKRTRVSWSDCRFDFRDVVIEDGEWDFEGIILHGSMDFSRAEFKGGLVDFRRSEVGPGFLTFIDAVFTGTWVNFYGSSFIGKSEPHELTKSYTMGINFVRARFDGSRVNFDSTTFSDCAVGFSDVDFKSGTVEFDDSRFLAADVKYSVSRFSGARVSFQRCDFSGGEIDFSRAEDWSVPPIFDFPVDARPDCVLLPTTPMASGASGPPQISKSD